jgi:hypothetical protein
LCRELWKEECLPLLPFTSPLSTSPTHSVLMKEQGAVGVKEARL